MYKIKMLILDPKSQRPEISSHLRSLRSSGGAAEDAFSLHAPVHWNKPPTDLRSITTVSTVFLTTICLFSQAYGRFLCLFSLNLSITTLLQFSVDDGKTRTAHCHLLKPCFIHPGSLRTLYNSCGDNSKSECVLMFALLNI